MTYRSSLIARKMKSLPPVEHRSHGIVRSERSGFTSPAAQLYVVTAVDSMGAESSYSNEAQAVIPYP